MDVVDREQHRLLQSEVGRKPVEAVENREECFAAGFVWHRGELRGVEERFREACRVGEQIRAEGGGRGGEQRLEELANDSVRKLALELAGAPNQHPHARRLGDQARRPEKAGLADTRASLDRHQPTVAAACSFDQLLQRGKLSLPFQKRGCRCRGSKACLCDQAIVRRAIGGLGVSLGSAPMRTWPVRAQSRVVGSRLDGRKRHGIDPSRPEREAASRPYLSRSARGVA